jgi:hypothetical protein
MIVLDLIQFFKERLQTWSTNKLSTINNNYNI